MTINVRRRCVRLVDLKDGGTPEVQDCILIAILESIDDGLPDLGLEGQRGHLGFEVAVRLFLDLVDCFVCDFHVLLPFPDPPRWHSVTGPPPGYQVDSDRSKGTTSVLLTVRFGTDAPREDAPV